MKVLIINLEKSIDRRNFQTQQCNILGLDYQFIAAVSVNDITDQQYHEQAFGWQRPLRKVELACFLSHKKAWQQVIELNQPCLILEDDAVLAKNIRKVLENIEYEQLSDIDLINLEVRSRKKIISKKAQCELINGAFKLFELYQDRTGAAGYLLYPSGAKKLLDRLNITAPAIADGFIFSSYELQCLQVEPALIIQEDQKALYDLEEQQHFQSIIGRSEHYQSKYSNWFEKIRFKQRRLLGQLAMAIRYVQVLPKAEKRFIRLDQTLFGQGN